MYGIISVDEAMQLQNAVFVDVRSEGEYAEDHLPNAFNLPIFNNQERAQLGIIYKEKGLKVARSFGLKIAAPKLPDMYEKLLPFQDKEIIFYCWRGGMRSKTVQTIFSLMGLKCKRLNGGYKAYRRFVNNFFQGEQPYEIVVLHGLTGVGKTEIINRLRERGINAVDLEGLASNRGSSYGSVAMPKQPTQKFFETLLFQEIWKKYHEKYVIMECESKRIGRVFLPESIFQGMKTGKHILVYDTVPNRIKRIIAEYAEHYDKHEVREQLLQSTKNLQQRLGKKVVANLQNLILENNLEPVVEYLLINYYDPLYKYPQGPSDEYDLCVDAACVENAVREIEDYIADCYQ